MAELSVYRQLSGNTSECLSAIKREIGMKTTCAPFAIKLITALSELSPRTAQEELYAANTLLSGLQTLMQGGIVAEDYDKIDFVKRGKAVVPSARVEAFLRASARKGYRITDSIIAVPKEDYETTFFKENFFNGDIIYTLEDRRINADRTITAKRLVDKYFSKFLCRLDIHEVKSGKRVAMTVCEMSIEDLLAIASASEQGLYKSKWTEYLDQQGNTRKRKVITNELNTDTFWVKWTGEMVNKTVIRRALKRVKEVLPELEDSIYAFESDDCVDETTAGTTPNPPIEIPVEFIEDDNVNLHQLSAEQQAECTELYDIYKANPKLAEDKFAEIVSLVEDGVAPQDIINKEYAALVVLKRSKAKWAKIGGYFDEKN